MELSEWSVVRREEFPLGLCPQPELLTSLYSLLTITGVWGVPSHNYSQRSTHFSLLLGSGVSPAGTTHFALLTPHCYRAVAERVLYVRGAFGLTPAMPTDRFL